MKHPKDVCSLSCRANSEPVYFPLQKTIHFFFHLIDALPSASLTGSFLQPWRTIRHCHVLHIYHNDLLRHSLSCGDAMSVYCPRYQTIPGSLTFWLQPVSAFGCLLDNAMSTRIHLCLPYKSFLAPDRFCTSSSDPPHGFILTGYVVPDALYQFRFA